ncbi:unnamed protein product [Linum tenue]|uniref:RRM domain-containing protein n=1 Tax=Linum tenue TaxID=586396 RepID=A0AAV0HRV1_9ROSI|nr:unnamed protein product [Linum tenue]
MSRKRDKPYFSGPDRAPLPKRRRPHPPPAADDNPAAKGKTHPPASVVVMGLSPDCSVLDLKSRFEIYGAISRIRIDGVGYITFRSRESAEAAIAAALDDSFGITVDSRRLQVLWATDPLAKWREGIRVGVNKSNDSSPSSGSASKLLRGELPLRRHGRGKKLASAIVNPRNNTSSSTSTLDVPFRGREIIAYDDIL